MNSRGRVLTIVWVSATDIIPPQLVGAGMKKIYVTPTLKRAGKLSAVVAIVSKEL
jgi:hypothetical protein